MTKRGSSFGLRAVMYLGGELALDFLIGEVFISDNAWMISGLKLSSTLPKVATKS